MYGYPGVTAGFTSMTFGGAATSFPANLSLNMIAVLMADTRWTTNIQPIYDSFRIKQVVMKMSIQGTGVVGNWTVNGPMDLFTFWDNNNTSTVTPDAVPTSLG